jgi:hypothetical protein
MLRLVLDTKDTKDTKEIPRDLFLGVLCVLGVESKVEEPL